MYRLRKLQHCLLLFVMVIMSFLEAHAGEEPLIFNKLEGAGGDITQGATMNIKDDVYHSPSYANVDLTKPQYLKTLISLEVVENSLAYIPADFDCEIRLSISYTLLNGSQVNGVEKVFKVSYRKNAGAKFDAKAMFEIADAHDVTVEVLNINLMGSTTSMLQHLIIYSRMFRSRDYKFNQNGLEAVSDLQLRNQDNVIHDNSSSSNPNAALLKEIVVGWSMNAASARTHYDIEWAWIDLTAQDRYKVNGQFSTELIFKDNATRVTISRDKICPLHSGDFNHHHIPVLYDDKGYLFYRVRPVQLLNSGRMVNGAWSCGESTVDYYYSEGFERSLNWQSTVSFAEEGKSKAVVQYFDGTLRNRQTATLDNTSKTLVIAETFYDYQGRPAIQVLPTPTLQYVLSYARNFNRFQGQIAGQDPKEIYDQVSTDVCNASTAALVSTGPQNDIVGAAQYYSSNNPLANQSFHKFIPDAEGYPYTETVYVQDGTGRVLKQSGVGATHKTGSGKETSYFYGAPTQKELDALFGPEAGEASHYSKNMVRDANGQYSVSYVDMKGRTVATALAGKSPDALVPLSYNNSSSTEMVTEDLLTRQNNIVSGRSIVSNSTLLVPQRGLYEFKYELNPESAEIIACNPPGQEVCYDCLYDLEITIKDDCGRVNIHRTRSNFSLGTLDPNCNPPAPSITVLDISEVLEEGEYNITKKLTLSSAGQGAYREGLFKQKNVCRTWQEFYDEILSIINGQGVCVPTCEQCHQAVGTLEAFRLKYLETLGLASASPELEQEIQSTWQRNKESCNLICGITDTKIKDYETQMLLDLTPPFGQYAKIDNISRDYNIFKPANGRKPYLNPLSANSQPDFYRNNFGQIDPTAHPNQTSSVASFPDESTFISGFKDSWARSLLPYHPEYCKYQKINSPLLIPSFEFDRNIEAIATFSAANGSSQANNFISNILNNDPFFNSSGVGHAFYDAMKNKIESDFIQTEANGVTKHYSMWQVAWMSVSCIDSDASSIDEACADQAPAMPPFNLTNCPGDWNKIWTIFRSMYLNEKSKYLEEYLNALCPQLATFYQSLHVNGYNRVFGSAGDLINNPGVYAGGLIGSLITTPPDQQPSVINAQMLEQFQRTCESYRQMWMAEIRQCPQVVALDDNTETDLLNEIMDALVDVCVRGSDVNHPLGSSTEAPNDSRDPDNFIQAIKAAFNRYGIQLDETCHPYLISFPKPYHAQQPLSDYPVITQDDPCVCERLAKVRDERLNDGFAGSLSDYLRYKYGISVSQAVLNQVQNGCSAVPDCKTYDPAIELPGFFSCGASMETCIDCEKYNDLKSQYLSQFTAHPLVPYAEPDGDIDKLNANISFERYMNALTGFNKTWMEYLRFQIACEGVQVHPCNELQELVTLFHQLHPNLTGQQCRDMFVLFFNQRMGTFHTWNDIVIIFIQSCGAPPDVCNVKANCTQLSDLLINFYIWYRNQPLPKPDCQTSFIAYFNATMGTDYQTWQELVDLYQSRCSLVLDICNDKPCSVVWYVVEQFQATNQWMFPDCSERFITYFNNFFQSNFTAEEVWEILQTCIGRVDVCNPPVSCETIQLYVHNYKEGNDVNCTSAFQPGSPEYCNDCFVQYMNASLNINFTLPQLQAMYSNLCGQQLDVCANNYSCEELTGFLNEFVAQFPDLTGTTCEERFIEEFNTHFSQSLEYHAIISIYLLYCGVMPNICHERGRFSVSDLDKIYASFIKVYPQPSAYFESCEAGFRKYFIMATGSKDWMSYASIDSLYVAITGSMPNICGNFDCSKVWEAYGKYSSEFGQFQLPPDLKRDIIVFFYNKVIQPRTNYSWQYVKKNLIYCGINPDTTANPALLPSCSTIEGAKRAFYLLNPGATAENCADQFAGFFNYYYKTLSWEYEYIIQWASTNCGYDLDICEQISAGGEINYSLLTERPAPSSVILPPRLCGLNMSQSGPPLAPPEDPCDFNITLATNAAHEQYGYYVQEQLNQFDRLYEEKCLQAAPLEKFTVKYVPAEYHYTLYYYDQAGNLIKTVPPEGVHPNRAEAYLAAVRNYRLDEENAPRPAAPEHTLCTQYRYNSLGQVVEQTTPDAGKSKFYYDVLGRLVLSQNAKQATANKYSYTIYDLLGRITEVGEKLISGVVDQALTQDPQALTTALNGTRYEITVTQYDEPYTPLCGGSGTVICQTNLRNRVSLTYTKSSTNSPDPWDAATIYSYDIHGNVDKLVQDYRTGIMGAANNRWKLIEYDYDLISGKVNEVSYQAGKHDAFYHKYSYDAENRLTRVQTSRERLLWETEALYEYYKHGPLARTVLGENRVQGVDYAYTLQGWLKGVNSHAVKENTDMGQDGLIGGPSAGIGRDVYGFSLNYYGWDYKPVYQAAAGLSSFAAGQWHNLTNTESNTVAAPLYNGNIASMMVNIPKVGDPLLYGYGYDQLNRIKSMDAFTGFDRSQNQFNGLPQASVDYKERVIYDANGNILDYQRNGAVQAQGAPMDQMRYQYERYSDGRLKSNRLRYVFDAVAAGLYSEDINNQTTFTNVTQVNADNQSAQQDDNFSYDEIGNLVKDASEGIASITWTVYGKIKSIQKGGQTITYEYDASGNRISKELGGKTTWYVRDAQGNVMSIYEKDNTAPLKQKEVHLYGSSRLGIYEMSRDMEELQIPGQVVVFERGAKFFELTNHLGNVLVTISDKRLPHQNPNNTSQADYFEADVVTANDYYPGGMTMPGRKYTSASVYRYGFNGKENDSEIYGESNAYDFGARIQDPRLVRWLSVDPLQKKYPDLNPFNFAGNNPITFYDPNGKEIIINYKDEYGKMQSLKYIPGIKPANNNYFVQQVHEAVSYVMKDDPSKTFQQLSDHKKTVTISEQLSGSSSGGDINQDRTGYNNVSVKWGANFGLRTVNGGGQAPSTVLLHESGHALGKLNINNNAELEAAINSRKLDGTTITNKEERRVIVGTETPYILAKNKSEANDINNITPPAQGVRNDHFGEYYPTMGVNSITPSDRKTFIRNLGKTFQEGLKPTVDGTYQPKPPLNN